MHFACVTGLYKALVALPRHITIMQTRRVVFEVPALFTHTLLFRCPDCRGGISVSCTTTESERETVDARPFLIRCETCRKSYSLPGWKAHSHSIKHVYDQQGTFALIIPPDSDGDEG